VSILNRVIKNLSDKRVNLPGAINTCALTCVYLHSECVFNVCNKCVCVHTHIHTHTHTLTMTDRTEECSKCNMITGGLNTLLSIMDRPSRQKINKEIGLEHY
jgi:hypothetical protein